MQILHYLPTQNQLALKPEIAQSVIDLLLSPFGSQSKAAEFWSEYSSMIVVLDKDDERKKSLACLSDITCHFIDQAEHSPEFIENLPEHYQLSLTITGDKGGGLYLIKPVNMRLTEEQHNDK